ALGDLARRSGTTLFMVLLAGFGTLLSRLAGQRDLVVGSPVANRTQRETEGLIGFFVNMLALRLDLSATSFAGLLERVRRVALDAYGHQELPFERVVEELGVQRDLSRNPLFQVVFTLQNTTLEPPDLPGLDLEVIPVDSGTSRFDLTLTLVPRQDGALRGPLEYNTDLFDATTAARWMSHLATLLGEAARQPELPLDRLHWLDDAQRHQIEREWNDTALRRPLAALPQLFARQAMRTPDALALVDRDERWTYRQLDERVRRLAAMLRPRGAAPGALVGLVCDRSAAMVAALLAILETGAAYLPLDPEYPAERLRFILDDARAALVVAGRRQRALVADHPHVVLEEALGAAPPASAGVVPRTPALDDLAYVIYTSGSTGRPKGVAVSHRNACNLMLALDELLGSEPTSLLAVTSISFDISVLELLWTLTRGSRVVLQGDRAVELYGASGPSTRVSAKAIDFSLFYFADDSGSEDPNAGGRYRLLLEGARFADRAGLSAVWTPERHFHAFGGLYPNPSVTGAAVAAVTERVAIRAGSVVLPLHNPLRVAEEWSVVDNLSGGRVGISVASGWHANDFVLAPVSADERRAAFERRKQTMLDHVDILRRLWRGEPSRGVNALGAEVELSI
ncbi:MAG: LLM class flavin-dependent oxidoreductase, partial [Acidobacteria bacterium]|nr:LLM class flavin-dependent oxidoreductase [Acidobacteriota bacterium]